MYAPTNEIIKRKKKFYSLKRKHKFVQKKSCETIKPFAVITMLGK